MKRTSTLCLFLIGLVLSLHSQIVPREVVILNGGQFGNPEENVNISLFNPETETYRQIDTIQTQSIQDAFIDGTNLYVAAQDSIVKYDIVSGERLAATAFGAPSTIHMELYEDVLLVGNWFAPFGDPGPFTNHFRIFDSETLAFVDSVDLAQGARDFVVIEDTAYITQNLSSSTFSDSAGVLVRVDLTSFSLIDTVQLNENGEDVGRLIVVDSILYSLNGASNTISQLNLTTKVARTDSLGVDLQASTYRPVSRLDQNGTLFTVINGNIASFDLNTFIILDSSVVDTVITAFALDTVNQIFYITQTDFSTFTGGGIYDSSGTRLDTLLVGFSPEVIEIAYNAFPQAQNDTFTLTGAAPTERLAVLDNDEDIDANELTLAILTPPTQGEASFISDSLQYLPNAGFVGLDSLQYALTDEWGDRDSAWVILAIGTTTSLSPIFTDELALYPNPTSGEVTVILPKMWSGELEIMDIQGRSLMYKKVSQQKVLSFELKNISDGWLIIRGINEEGYWMGKVLKKSW